MTDTLTETVSSPRIDPRFARRWVEVRRQAGRRRLHMVATVAILIVLVAAAMGAFYTPLLKVRHLRVTVRGAVSPAAVAKIAGLDRYKLMIDVSPAAITKRLDAVADLGGARVDRRWPGSVTVSVSVRTPIAQVDTGHGWATVDPTGRILADVPAQIPGMPILVTTGAVPAVGRWLSGSLGPVVAPGLTPTAEVQMDATADTASVPSGAAAALVAVQALPPSIRGEVISVSDPPSRGLSMDVLPADLAAGSIPVNFGDGSQLAAKLTSLTTLLDQVNLSGVVSIDLTDPNRPAALTAR